jgi:glycosyltransferase involved in cell wall biosynthesis
MTIYIVPIEPISSRYTEQWYEHIPSLLDAASFDDIVIIDGDNVPPVTTPGAFLDFAATNIYKSSQLELIAQLFREGKVMPGDKFLYTDAWNPTVIQLKYTSSLLGIPIDIHGMWHAGSYDSFDFLGRLVGDTPWVRNAELSMFDCYDTNWFATNFHIDLFMDVLLKLKTENNRAAYKLSNPNKIKLTGWPMEYMGSTLAPFPRVKKDKIIFPHRLAPEKQLDIFKDLAASMPEYEWFVAQEQPLTKDEYHKHLSESKIIFSANLQETLGISTCAEGPIAEAIPLAPNRLSYSEIFEGYDDFLYPSEWTTDFSSYLENKDKLINKIRTTMDNYVPLSDIAMKYIHYRMPMYFSADALVDAFN